MKTTNEIRLEYIKLYSEYASAKRHNTSKVKERFELFDAYRNKRWQPVE